MSGEFGDYIEDRKERGQSKFKKTLFYKLDEGEHLARIMDSHEVRHYTHYINFSYIACLGDECPICQNNKKIIYEHPEDFRDVRGWNSRRDRYYINVLDRTVVKTCSKCSTEAHKDADVCPQCGTVFTEPAAPSNKIKILTGGKELFEDLKVLSKSVRDDDDNRIDIRTYDWLFIVQGKRLDKKVTIKDKYSPAKAGLLEVPEGQELFNLNECVIKLEPEEMLDMLNGTALKDIFAVRRSKKEAESVDVLASDIREEISNSIDEIFKTE